MTKNQKPDGLLQDHLVFLDELRESGVTNMFGAVPYLMEFDENLSRNKANNILSYWMKNFKG